MRRSAMWLRWLGVMVVLMASAVAVPTVVLGDDASASTPGQIRLMSLTLNPTSATITDTSAPDVFPGVPTTPGQATGTGPYVVSGPNGSGVTAVDPPNTVQYIYTQMATSNAGTFFLLESTGYFTFVPKHDYINGLRASATETLTFTVTDSANTAANFTLTITGVDEDPLVVVYEDDLTTGLPAANFSMLSGSAPGSEGVDKAFDDNTATKYLNFGLPKPNGGNLFVGPADASIDMGEGVVVNGLGLTTANDAPGRDPVHVSVYGSAAPFSSIGQGQHLFTASLSSNPAIVTTSARTTEYADFSFDNVDAFRYYQVVVHAVEGSDPDPNSTNDDPNSFQVSEIRLPGLRLDQPLIYVRSVGPVTVSAGVRLLGDDVSSLTYSITDGHNANSDVLELAGSVAGITSSFDAVGGVLTLTSTSAVTIADWQQAARLVTYSSPTDSAVTPQASRTFRLEMTNLSGTTSSAEITMETADRTVLWSAQPSSLTFGTPLSVSATASAGGGLVTYSTSGNCVYGSGFLVASTAASPATCELGVEVGEDGVYTTVSAKVPLTLSISKASVTVTAPSPTVTVGSDAGTLTPTYTGLVGSDSELATPPSCTTTYTTSSPAGTYPVTCSGGSDVDYSVTYVAGVLTASVPAVVPAPPASTAPSTSAPAAPPQPLPVAETGELPALEPGVVLVVGDGVTENVEVLVETPVEEGDPVSQLVLRSEAFEMRLSGECGAGCGIEVDDAGRQVLRLTEEGGIRVSGEGFAEGSEVDVWMFSDPQYIGSVLVGADGTFADTLALPEIGVGEHTLQINGTSGDGRTRSVNLGVVVGAASADFSDGLPATGGEPRNQMASALMLVVLGAVAIGARRRLSGRVR